MASRPGSMAEERRLFIQDLLERQYGRQVVAISRLGRDSNNFVYHVQLSQQLDSSSEPSFLVQPSRPGTVALPAGKTDVVMRISNPEAMVNEEVRVQNEVAAMHLMRHALAKSAVAAADQDYDNGYDYLVPLVYAWNPSSPASRGWILQEYKPGVQLDKAFGLLDREKQQVVLGQIATVFKLVQSYALPDPVRLYGGLGFDDTGRVVAGPTTIPCGGPFTSCAEMYSQMLRRQLDEAETSELLQGWRSDGLRDRLERFASDGIAPLVLNNSLERPTLVHGDFNMFNMLYDAASNRLTALLDYDFSHVATPADEFFYSFHTMGSLLAGPFESGDEGRLRKCLLEGFRGNTPTEGDGRGRVDWTVAVDMDAAFRCAGVRRPADIPGCGELAAVKWFLEDVSPPYFNMSRWVAHTKPEKIAEIREGIRENIDKYLLRWGY